METKLSKQEIYTVTLEKIVPEGKTLAHIDEKVIFVNGGLPGEKAKIQIYKNKKTFSEARLVEIVEASDIRVLPKEPHYLICSPWQVLPYEKQLKYMNEILKEAYQSMANTEIEIKDFYESEEMYGYRTKLEFSFTSDDEGKIILAFHKRGVNNEYEKINGCMLGSKKMNKAAEQITEALNKIPGIEAKGLKSLVIRESKTNNQIIAILYYKFREYNIDLKIEDFSGVLDGLYIAYSTIKSPMAVVTELKYAKGQEYLEEHINSRIIRYPYDGFFQNNIPVFQKALSLIVNETKKSNKIVELYSGAGTIGLNLAEKATALIGIEIVESAVKYAEINASLNQITNYQTLALADRDITVETLSDTEVLVVDPPRAGLHKKVIAKIRESQPKQITYLSCNPITQARDYNDLKDMYKIRSIYGFDFYPNTFHLESLLILDLVK